MIYAALAHLFAVMSPGPDTAIIIREVSLNKRRGGLFCAFGIGVGILIHCYLAIFGISTLLLSNNIAGDLISTFGSFYLIFIGISSFKSESQTSKKSHLMSSSFINGFITNIFNIKAFICHCIYVGRCASGARASVGDFCGISRKKQAQLRSRSLPLAHRSEIRLQFREISSAITLALATARASS